MTGTIYHAFQHYAAEINDNTFNPAVVEFQQGGAATVDEEARMAAQHMFEEHRRRHPIDYLGRIIHSEHDIPRVNHIQKDEEAIRNAFWNPMGARVTCRIDRVVKTTKRQVHYILNTFGISVETGVHLVDFKTGKSLRWINGYYVDVAPSLYLLLWNTVMPKNWRAKGMFIDQIENTKKANNLVIFIPAPDARVTGIISQQLGVAIEAFTNNNYHSELSGPVPNTKHCLDYGRWCCYALNGDCPAGAMLPGLGARGFF